MSARISEEDIYSLHSELPVLFRWSVHNQKNTSTPVRFGSSCISSSCVTIDSGSEWTIRCLADFEKGVTLSEVEKERFWEQYQHYKDNGGNTYIVEWTERLKKEGKI